MAKWEIGNYQFQTEKEYRAGLRDFEKIRKIMECSDVENPENALKIYQGIRDGKFTFETRVGARFTDFLIDCFAHRLDEVKRRRREKSLGRRIAVSIRRTVAAVCTLTVVAGSGYFAFYHLSEYKSTQALKELSESVSRTREQINASGVQPGGLVSETLSGEEKEASGDVISGIENAVRAEGMQALTKYRNLLLENEDLAGWIRIGDTGIDYPVMLTPGNEEFYLHRNFQKMDDMNGLPFLNKDTDLKNRNTNMIIYGHHMKTGEMFGKLQNYKNRNYWERHKTIAFDTIYEEGRYEVVAVFPSRVYKEDENVFKYYQFVNAQTEEEFHYFVNNVKSLSLYDTGVEPAYGDTFITLSTCDYAEEDGRFVVVARRMQGQTLDAAGVLKNEE